MMRTILTLAIVVGTLNAAGRVGSAYWTHYQFEDAAQQTILFNGLTSPETLQSQLLEKARKLEVPIEPDALKVTRLQQLTRVEAQYVQTIELFPRYTYPFKFEFQVESQYSGSLRPSDNR